MQGAEHKSYGGLTIRFRPTGAIRTDRFITTDEGVAKDDMPEKRLRWADYTSRFGAIDAATGNADALSGAAIFLAPSFPDFPPTWLTRYYGPLCLGYPGVDAQRFAPGEKIVMPVEADSTAPASSAEDCAVAEDPAREKKLRRICVMLSRRPNQMRGCV